MAKNPQVLVDKAALDFYMAEAAAIHGVCDRALVPMEIEGSALSMSQRVSVLEGVYRGLIQRIGMDPPTTTH